MTMPIGFNFRSTVGYVTDIAPDVFITTTNTYAASPGYGWDVNPSGTLDSRDRNAANIANLAGVNFYPNSATAASFRVDLPSAGTYAIRLASGDASGIISNIYLELFDNASSLGVLINNASTSAGQRFLDATSTEYTNATWAGSNTAVNKTFASTILRLKMGGASASAGTSIIAYLGISLVNSGGHGGLTTLGVG